MAVDVLKYASGNSASTTLAVAMSNSDTSATLTSDTNFSAKSGAGMTIIDEGTATEELAYATGKSGSALTIPLANRGLEGGAAQAHQLNSSVKGIISAGMWNDVIDTLKNGFLATTGAVDTTKVVTPSGTQTLTNKTIDGDDNTLTDLPAANLKIASQAQGDILYRGSSAWSRLGAGTSGQFLKTQGTGANPIWADASATAGTQRVRAKRTSNQTISNNTLTAIAWDNEDYDTDTMHDNASNNTRLTFTTAGVYHVTGSFSWGSNTTGVRFVYIRLNGSTNIFLNHEVVDGANGNASHNVAFDYSFSASDYIEMMVDQASGGNLDFTGTEPNHFSAFRVG